VRQRSLFIGAAIAVIVALGAVAWYLFRPERAFVNQTVNERFPMSAARSPVPAETGAKVLASGMFHKVAKETKGTATVYQLASGKEVLRLTGFETANGPDLHVYLVAARDALDTDTVKQVDHVELGLLKGNIGDQNYDIPEGTDLSKYQAVSIWCNRFSVNFGTAPLATK
jgi:hypothetical protein